MGPGEGGHSVGKEASDPASHVTKDRGDREAENLRKPALGDRVEFLVQGQVLLSHLFTFDMRPKLSLS